MTNNKANQWVLDKFLVHKIEGLGDDATVIENSEKIGEVQITMQRAKINTSNAAISIPVTSAIIKL